jgi:tape measure domain-containing protein
MTTERIDIIVSERGSRTVKRNIEDIGGSARAAAGGVQFLQRALLSLGVGLGVAQLIRMADTYTLITNRLRLVTTGTANLARVNEELFQSAQRTRSSYEATAQLYATVARNADTLGLSQKDLLDITETVNQSIAVSGTSAQGAAAGLIQLSQALGSGTLRGDELNSILENMPRLAQAIADGMGVTIGQLRALGAEGKLTSSEIVEAIRKSAPEIAAEFAQMTPTVGSSIQALSDSFMKFIGELDQSLGITAGLANAILFLANHMDTLGQVAAVVAVALAAAFAVSLVGSIAAIVSQVIALELALGATSTASALFGAALKIVQGGVRALTAAIAANPIGLLLVAITTIVSYLYIFRDEISVTADGVVSLGDVFRSIFSFIGELIGPVVDFFKSAWADGVSSVTGALGTFLDAVIDILSAVVGFAKTIVNTYIGLWVGAYKAIVAAWGLFGPAMKDLGVIAMNGLIEVVEGSVNGIVKAVGDLLEFIGSAAELVGLDNPFAGLLDGDVIDLSGFKGTVTGAASDVAGIVRDEFATAFSTDYVGNLIGAVMDRAREIAVARAAQEAAGGLNPAGTSGALPGTPGAGGGDGGGRGGH